MFFILPTCSFEANEKVMNDTAEFDSAAGNKGCSLTPCWEDFV